jgi:tetratricopeptide (TPR) repeat protein
VKPLARLSRSPASGPLLAVLLLTACQSGPRRVDEAVDPNTYSVCRDAEAMAAWERARSRLAAGDDAGALPDLLLCTSRCPDLVRAHVAYQDCARRLGGDVAQAMIQTYSKAPERPSPVRAYLQARFAETSYAQCNALEAILAKDPSFAWAHLSRGRVTRLQGRLLPALDMFAAAIVNDPQLHEARLERAQVLEELGRYQEAAVDYQRYLTVRPDDIAAAREYIGLLLYRLSRIDEAIVWLDRLEQQLPGDSTLRMDRAAALWRAKRPREAVAAYLALLRERPQNARAALNIGLLYYEVAPQNDTERQMYWPKARAAFRWFLEQAKPADGHEQFERTLGVPFRLERIAELLGPAAPGSTGIDELAWPVQG